MQVVTGKTRWVRSAVAGWGDLQLVTIWGRTYNDRPLLVAVRLLGNMRTQIIGARDLRPEELAEFEAWEASGGERDE
jgi:hypothetical protein